MIRLFIIDDVSFYAEGLAECLDRSSDIEVVGTSGAVGARASCDRHAPDVVLIDPAVSGSLDAMQDLARQKRRVQILALVPETEREVIACAEAGVVGYVSREASMQELCEAIHHAASGELHRSPRAARGLLATVEQEFPAPGVHSMPHQVLTRRESDIVRLIDLGMSNKEIAQELHISISTVKNHVHNLLQKLGVSRRGEAAAHLRSTAGGSVAALTGSKDLVPRAAAPQELDPGVDPE